MKKLLANGHQDYALDFANRAQLLSDDKTAFHDLPWMRALTADGIKHAGEYVVADEQWYKAMRLYSDLAAVEPASKEWKEKLKSVTRRVRLLAMYAPDQLKQIQDADIKERDAVDQLLNPSTQPATKPAMTRWPRTTTSKPIGTTAAQGREDGDADQRDAQCVFGLLCAM